MSSSDLFSRLNQMRQEIKALKCAHPRGLGVVDFFTESFMLPSAFGQLTITAEGGQVVPFFLNLGAATLYTFDSYNISVNGRTVTMTISAQRAETLVTVVSSAKVSLSWESA